MKTIITLNNFDEDILEDLKAMIDILNERPLPIYKIVDRLPRKKDSNTIYIKEMKEKYIEYVWLDGKWHIVAEIKKEKKMRLIDADVFKTEYENLITWVSHRAEKARLREFIKDIQNQPTVKAIPMEWIRKWQRQHNAIIAGYISYMLLDWEKENSNR